MPDHPEALRQALAALEYHQEQTRPIQRTIDTIASIKAALAEKPADTPATQDDEHPYTYASTQATHCAGCGQYKHTPLRIDAMGGYVCLTCIDRKLGALLGEFGYPEPEAPMTREQAVELYERERKFETFADDPDAAAVRAIQAAYAQGIAANSLDARALSAPEAAPRQAPDGVHEALQRLIENAAVHGQASQEDAILVARYRDAALGARQAPELVPLVQLILSNALAFEWSLQGMGMLRLHLPGNYRLHVWDSRYRTPNVSMVHDHLQWGLHSTIVAGRLVNRRYVEADDGEPYNFTTLKPGYGCYFKHDPKPCSLKELEPDVYGPGESYSQAPAEIHETDAEDGTVTLMRCLPLHV
jgi:hypothetical protein